MGVAQSSDWENIVSDIQSGRSGDGAAWSYAMQWLMLVHIKLSVPSSLHSASAVTR